jgi:hypothetical protein
MGFHGGPAEIQLLNHQGGQFPSGVVNVFPPQLVLTIKQGELGGGGTRIQYEDGSSVGDAVHPRIDIAL